ncbi:MAG: RipA family octameric membrane protein [Nannocystaceae bacterium]
MTPLEKFTLCWEHANRLMSRRQSATTVYLSVNSAILAALAYMLKGGHPLTIGQKVAMVLLMVAGCVACIFWRRLIMRYSALLDWWYAELRDLEQEHRELGGIISREYQVFYTDTKKHADTRKRPRLRLTVQENQLTWLFTGIYIVFSTVLLGSIGLDIESICRF